MRARVRARVRAGPAMLQTLHSRHSRPVVLLFLRRSRGNRSAEGKKGRKWQQLSYRRKLPPSVYPATIRSCVPFPPSPSPARSPSPSTTQAASCFTFFLLFLLLRPLAPDPSFLLLPPLPAGSKPGSAVAFPPTFCALAALRPSGTRDFWPTLVAKRAPSDPRRLPFLGVFLSGNSEQERGRGIKGVEASRESGANVQYRGTLARSWRRGSIDI